MRTRISVCMALALTVAITSSAAAQSCPRETPGDPPAAKAKGELQPGDRTALALPLGAKSQGQDDVTLPLKGVRLRRNDIRGVSATLSSFPRKGDQRLDGRVFLAASPTPTGTSVRVRVCVESKGMFTAGTYTGNVTVFGPKIREFNYPMTVTERWPPIVPIALIALVAIAVLVAVWSTPLPVGRGASAADNVITCIVALGAMVLTYWGVYETNETWGENPGADITALVAGALASGVAGIAVARQRLNSLHDPGQVAAGASGAGGPAGASGPGGPDSEPPLPEELFLETAPDHNGDLSAQTFELEDEALEAEPDVESEPPAAPKPRRVPAAAAARDRPAAAKRHKPRTNSRTRP